MARLNTEFFEKFNEKTELKRVCPLDDNLTKNNLEEIDKKIKEIVLKEKIEKNENKNI